MASIGEECSTSDMIETKEECKTAASQLAHRFNNAEEESTEKMKGCYLTPNPSVKFNKISTSCSTARCRRNNGGKHGMCKKQGICLRIYIKFKLIIVAVTYQLLFNN